ncbi:MAG: hypothetical protein ABIR67_08135 [Gaiellaceae bacterium]
MPRVLALAVAAMAAFVLVGSVVSSAQAAAAGATSFSGTTSQRMAITFELSAGWRSIGRFRVTYRAECGGGRLVASASA